MKDTRRNFIKKGTGLSVLSAFGLSTTQAYEKVAEVDPLNQIAWPVIEGPDTPKLTLSTQMNETPEQMRVLKQIGVDYVLMRGPALPWTEEGLRTIMDRFKTEGLTVINMMIHSYSGPMSSIIYNLENRDAAVQIIIDSIKAAGAVGLPIVEYNWYPHRLQEGYYTVPGRGGSEYLRFDYNRVSSEWNYPWPSQRTADEMNIAPKDLKPKPGMGTYTSEELWENITYFLKAVIPVAEQSNVRMALHPNDPPVPLSRGSEQIIRTFDDWKRLVNIVDSPSNGMTFDCGVSHEIGENPLEVLDYLASRDRINHVHYRNCIVEIPSLKYMEVFPDNGNIDMFAVMQQLVKRKYKYGLWAEHPRALDYGDGPVERFPSQIYNQGYAKAMLQSALTIEQREMG